LRSIELGLDLIAARTGLDLSDLSPAEEKIVRAVSEYVGVKKRTGSDATRTFIQLRNRGLIGAAEAAVAHSKPTQGAVGTRLWNRPVLVPVSWPQKFSKGRKASPDRLRDFRC
jgi:hypothetical protein